MLCFITCISYAPLKLTILINSEYKKILLHWLVKFRNYNVIPKNQSAVSPKMRSRLVTSISFFTFNLFLLLKIQSKYANTWLLLLLLLLVITIEQKDIVITIMLSLYVRYRSSQFRICHCWLSLDILNVNNLSKHELWSLLPPTFIDFLIKTN